MTRPGIEHTTHNTNGPEGIERPNQEKIRMLGRKGNLQILGNIGSGHHQTRGDERKNEKEYHGRTTKLLETSRNFIKGINTGAVGLVRYSGAFLKWRKKELKQTQSKIERKQKERKVLRPC